MIALKNKMGLGLSGVQGPAGLAQINQAIEIGYRLFDTAEMYGEGEGESTLGQALKESGLGRDNFEIVSKVRPIHCNSFVTLKEQCELSLARLQTDYIDCYLIHWLAPHQRDQIKLLADIVKGFAKLQRTGQIRSIGVSNFSNFELNLWQQVEDSLELPPEQRARVAQYRYNLQINGARDLNDRLESAGICQMIHSPFGGGKMGGMMRDQNSEWHSFFKSEQYARLEPVAASIGAETSQLILAFLHRNSLSRAIPRTFQKNRLQTNWEMQRFIPLITEEIAEQIWAVWPRNDWR